MSLSVQWGVGVSSASGTTTLTYHLAYSNFAAVFTGNTSGDKSTSPVNMTNVGLSSCRIHVKDDARYYADSFNWFALGFQQWGIKAASTYTWTYPLPLAVVYYADMMGYRKGSAGSEYGWIRSISPIAFETYIIDESAICFCVGIAQQWGTYETANASNKLITITFPVSFAATACSVALGHKGFSNWTNGANVNYVNKTVSDMTVYYCDGYGFSWLAIGMQQWGNKQYSSWQSTRFDYPISMTTVYTALASRQLEDADKTEFGCTILTAGSQFLTFMGYFGTANIVVLGR